jgi:hypothetical protein
MHGCESSSRTRRVAGFDLHMLHKRNSGNNGLGSYGIGKVSPGRHLNDLKHMVTLTHSDPLPNAHSLSNGKKQKKRPALSGTQETLAEREKREKRSKRFDQEKAAFDHQDTIYYDYGTSNSSGNLAGRLGAVSVSAAPVPLMKNWGMSNGGASSVNPLMRMNDSSVQSSWRGINTAAGTAGRKWGTSMQSAAFADTEVADPVSIERECCRSKRSACLTSMPFCLIRTSLIGIRTQSSDCRPNWRSHIYDSLLHLIQRRSAPCRL